MNKQDKELLLKDLSARLPYGVKVRIGDDDAKAPLIEIVDVIGKDYKSENAVNGWSIDRIGIKSYLRPMSSMTEKEKDRYNSFINRFEGNNLPNYESDFVCVNESHELVDWLNAHHLDYRNLIPMGLALPAPEGMYNF